MTAPTIPDHGYLDGLDPEVYHTHSALSSGQARTLLKSPARYRYDLGRPKTPTREMLIGTCVHTQVLGAGQGWGVAEDVTRQEAEAAGLLHGWGVLPDGDGRTKAVRNAKADMEDVGLLALKLSEAADLMLQQQGLIALTASDAELVRGMAAAVLDHPEAGRLFASGAGVPERALFWTDPATGVRCRALVDWTLNSGRGLVDLKTTGDASRSAIPKHMDRYGYPIQAVHYLRGAWQLGITETGADFLWVFVEREPPHMVTVCRLTDTDIEWARDQIEQAYQMHRDCTEAGHWPAGDEYPDGIVTVSLPPWARRRYEEETPEW